MFGIILIKILEEAEKASNGPMIGIYSEYITSEKLKYFSTSNEIRHICNTFASMHLSFSIHLVSLISDKLFGDYVSSIKVLDDEGIDIVKAVIYKVASIVINSNFRSSVNMESIIVNMVNGSLIPSGNELKNRGMDDVKDIIGGLVLKFDKNYNMLSEDIEMIEGAMSRDNVCSSLLSGRTSDPQDLINLDHTSRYIRNLVYLTTGNDHYDIMKIFSNMVGRKTNKFVEINAIIIENIWETLNE